MKWFKTKEEKLKELESKVKELNLKFKDVLHSYHVFNGKDIVVVNKFAIYKDDIKLEVKLSDTPEGYLTCFSYWYVEQNINLEKTRLAFVKLRQQLNSFGLQITEIKNGN